MSTMKNQESLFLVRIYSEVTHFLENFQIFSERYVKVRSYPIYHIFRLIVSCTGKITR